MMREGGLPLAEVFDRVRLRVNDVPDLKRILEKAFPGVTAAARLQQMGLFALIHALQSEEEPAQITEVSDGQVLTHVRRLVAIELIERTNKNQEQAGPRSRL